jgi:hypothetical protein
MAVVGLTNGATRRRLVQISINECLFVTKGFHRIQSRRFGGGPDSK